MSVIRITKEFNFEMSHALLGYDGLCKNIHGHSYRLFVTLKGKPNQDPSSPKVGMVIDFGILKKIIAEEIEEKFDHALVLNKQSELSSLLKEKELKIVVVDYQPTCENLLTDFAASIKKRLPHEVTLFSLKLYETKTSYAEWFAEDNL